MTTAITSRRRDTCNQFAYPKESRTLESGAGDNMDTIKTVRRSILPLYQQVKLRGYKVNFKLDSGANTILCVVKRPRSRLGNPYFRQWRPSTKLQMRTHY